MHRHARKEQWWILFFQIYRIMQTKQNYNHQLHVYVTAIIYQLQMQYSIKYTYKECICTTCPVICSNIIRSIIFICLAQHYDVGNMTVTRQWWEMLQWHGWQCSLIDVPLTRTCCWLNCRLHPPPRVYASTSQITRSQLSAVKYPEISSATTKTHYRRYCHRGSNPPDTAGR